MKVTVNTKIVVSEVFFLLHITLKTQEFAKNNAERAFINNCKVNYHNCCMVYTFIHVHLKGPRHEIVFENFKNIYFFF